MIAASLIDYDPALKVTNIESLPSGTGARYLLVVESPYCGEYIAKKWLRKLSASVSRIERIIRF